MITIRKSGFDDLDAIMRLYDEARQFMRSTGNLHQWVNGYPSRELVTSDIRRGVSYVGEDEHGTLVMVFAFILGADPTYAIIEDGAWLNDHPYGTIHRLATDGHREGMLRRCVEFCMRSTRNLRLDTHADNLPMQHAASRLGFSRCGIIYCDDGTPRIAYHKSL